MASPSHGAVKEHANKLVEELAKQKKISLEPGDDAKAVAAMIPTWTKGTTPIDEETGAPVVATEATVDAMPDEAAGAVVPEEATAEEKPRDEKGRFVAETEEQPEQQPVAEQPPADVAVEAAAAEELAKPDPFADYEEVEYSDPDLDKTFKVLARKDEAAAVKRGYSRQADYTRKTMALASVRKELQPLIDNGTINQIIPLVSLALNDAEYGNFVVEAARRRALGLPLTPAQEQAAQVAQVASAAQAPPQQTTPLNENEDPFMAQYLAPVRSQIQEVTEMVRGIATDQQRRDYEIAQQNQQRQATENLLRQTHVALQQAFPDEFNGDMQHDDGSFRKALDYANRSGYTQAYGYHPMTFVSAWNQYRQERAQVASSPAAEAVQQAQAQQIVRAAAATVPTGTPTANHPKKAVPPPPATRQGGIAADPKEYLQQALVRRKALIDQQSA